MRMIVGAFTFMWNLMDQYYTSGDFTIATTFSIFISTFRETIDYVRSL